MKIIDLFLPVRQARKAAQSLFDLKETVTDAAKVVTTGNRIEENLPNDPKVRFELLYERYQWTDEELAEQIKAVRNAKLTFLVLTPIALILWVLLFFVIDSWVFLLMASWGVALFVIMGAAQIFRFSLWHLQLHERSLIGAREFLARPDFWEWLIR